MVVCGAGAESNPKLPNGFEGSDVRVFVELAAGAPNGLKALLWVVWGLEPKSECLAPPLDRELAALFTKFLNIPLLGSGAGCVGGGGEGAVS